MSNEETLVLLNAALFWTVAIGVVSTALLVVLNRNPVGSALSLVATMVLAAMLMIQTGAFFLGVVQVLVYAGAVMVLFLFIIMLLDVREEAGKVWNPANLVLGAAVSGCLGYAIFRVAGQFASGPDVTALSEPEGGDDVRLLGLALFSEHAAPVIVIGFLLLVAMAGVIVLCQQPKAQVKTGEVK